jgi:pilus assembly protein CpaB
VRLPEFRNVGVGMNKKLVIIIGIAFLAATGSTYFFYQMISASEGGAGAAKHVVVVATHELRRGQELGPDDIAEASWSGAELPAEVLTDPKAALGNIVKRDILEGAPLTESLVLLDSQAFISARIRPGMRAVSVHVTEFAGVTRIFEPGDRVDVLLATARPIPGDGKVTLKTILQNVEVLTTGYEQIPGSRSSMQPVATLLVDVQDSEMLNTADHAGFIRLALRNPLDDGVEETSKSQLSDVLKRTGPGAAATRRISDRSKAPKPKTPAGTQMEEISSAGGSKGDAARLSPSQ